MLRRISTKVGITKSKKEEANGTTNGTTNGVHDGKHSLEKRISSFMPNKASKKTETPDHTASRGDVESSFDQFASLIHAARRPLPSQSGDGAYLDHAEPSGLMQDIKSMGFKDAKTLMEVMRTKATGDLQDDKTYIMERTIQVITPLLRIQTNELTSLSIARC